MKKYISPDLKSVNYKVEDIITVSETDPEVQTLAKGTYDTGSTVWQWGNTPVDLTD